MTWDTVLFDLDGTLTDPKTGITTAYSLALEKFGIHAEPDSLNAVIGPPLMDSFQELFGLSREEAVEAVREYRVYFSAKGWAENVPYPGIRELLDSLRSEGKRLIVATSKPEVFSLRILEHFGLAEFFTQICGAPLDESDAGKKENVIAAALLRAGVDDLSRAVMVGDRSHDILGARKNGLASVGVLYGYGSREELVSAGADHITESVQSLGALLRQGR